MFSGTLYARTNKNTLSNDLVKGFEFLENTNFSEIKDGKYIISDTIYANLQTYETKPSADFEAHREYIDIQYLIDGEENIEVTPYSSCEPKIEYDKEKDIEFLSGSGELNTLRKGDFMVLYPEDAHKPSLSIDKDNPSTVRKVVVKVKISD